MDKELLKKKYFLEGNYMLICPGSTKASGGMLISPFYDSILENAWLELNNFDKREGEFLTVKIDTYKRPISEYRNFIEDSLENFIERFEYLVKIEEDTVAYLKEYKKIKTYKELKSHCYEVVGEEYFNIEDN